MTWFKVDDKFYSHRKVRDLSKGAKALWLMSGSYCADHLTDGLVCPSDVSWLGGTADEADELVAAGLWLLDPEGYRFHDWTEYQPSAESRKAEREKWRERQAAHRDRKKSDTSVLPVPSRPESRRESRRDTSVTPADPEKVADIVTEIRTRMKGGQG